MKAPEGKIEDRVFGMSHTWPSPSLATHASTTADLFSASVEGAETVYACQGAPANPPLLFVHGWAASHKFWRHAFTSFSPRYRCLAPDLVGFGLSEKPDRDYSIDAYSTWLGRLMDALKIDHAPIVAHSMGATIALRFALDNPDRVDRLVVVNPVIQGSTAFDFRTRFLGTPGIRRLTWWAAHCGPFRRWISSLLDERRVLDPDMADDVISGTFQSTFRSLTSLMQVDLIPRLGALAVPTLLVGTDADRVVRPSQQDLLTDVKRETILETDHIPMLERPKEFNRIVDAFLRDGAPKN